MTHRKRLWRWGPLVKSDLSNPPNEAHPSLNKRLENGATTEITRSKTPPQSRGIGGVSKSSPAAAAPGVHVTLIMNQNSNGPRWACRHSLLHIERSRWVLSSNWNGAACDPWPVGVTDSFIINWCPFHRLVVMLYRETIDIVQISVTKQPNTGYYGNTYFEKCAQLWRYESISFFPQ